MPEGPSTLVLPGTGKSFDQFRIDDMDCRQFAAWQLRGSSPAATAIDSGVRSAVLGTVLGAVAGAAADGSHGAGVGAGAGLALGGLAGTGSGNLSAHDTQRRYDISYQQCMYTKGNRIPVYGGFSAEQYFSPRGVPPPPGGKPPPPPPGVVR